MARAAVMSTRRRTAFRIVSSVLGVLTLAAIVPFTVMSFTSDTESVHRMHNAAALVTLGGLLGVLLLVVARQPEEQLAGFRVVGAASVVGVIAGVLSGDVLTGGSLIGAVAFAITWWLHPRRGDVFTFDALRVEPALVAFVALVPATAWALTQARLQRHGVEADPHAAAHHYSTMANVPLTLAAAGLAAALGGDGRLLAARFVGVCWALTGALGLALDGYPGAFEPLWSWALVLGGFVYVAASEVAERRSLTPIEKGAVA